MHTPVLGTLPRPYDRTLVSNTFMIDQGILEKTLNSQQENGYYPAIWPQE